MKLVQQLEFSLVPEPHCQTSFIIFQDQFNETLYKYAD